MHEFRKGRYRIFTAENDKDVQRSIDLRGFAFGDRKRDAYDYQADHILIEDVEHAQIFASFRMMIYENGGQVGESYSAKYYDLGSFQEYQRPMLEIGRFCTHPAVDDPDLIRAAWAAITRVVVAQKIGFIFGCTSFSGVDPSLYLQGFSYLAGRHLAPAEWRPARKSAEIVDLSESTAKENVTQIPTLLRSYLMLGGRVSDHAVIDREMDTIHVFTGVDVETISPARKRLLRDMSA